MRIKQRDQHIVGKQLTEMRDQEAQEAAKAEDDECENYVAMMEALDHEAEEQRSSRLNGIDPFTNQPFTPDEYRDFIENEELTPDERYLLGQRLIRTGMYDLYHVLYPADAPRPIQEAWLHED